MSLTQWSTAQTKEGNNIKQRFWQLIEMDIG